MTETTKQEHTQQQTTTDQTTTDQTTTDQTTTTEQLNGEKHIFNADIQQLMNLIVHNLYSNKDIFLREIISNASDALDKLRYNILHSENPSLLSGESCEIKITLDKTGKTITIDDNGIGMSKQDLFNNLGTIARSGTKNMMKILKESNDMNMIGQFGVGFYSVFLVSDHVEVYSRTQDATESYVWKSDGTSSFTIGNDSSGVRKTRGTTIIISVKDDCVSYLEEYNVRTIVKQHSQYVNYPIKLLVHKTKEVEVENETDVTEENAKVDDVKVEDAKVDDVKVEDVKEGEEEGEESKKKTVTEEYTEWEQLNGQKPLWIRDSSKIKDEEYKEFYKNLTSDWNDYAMHKHFKVEGQIDATGILFLPENPPQDLFQGAGSAASKRHKIKLYVRRVFVTDQCPELIPEYLQFVSGIIDSQDLPLTVSREMLQENKIIKMIRKSITKQVISMMEKLSEDEEKFKKFYSGFSKNIKLGVYEEASGGSKSNSEKFMKLLRFSTTKGNDRTLDQYVADMKEGQPGIYYISGESQSVVENSPFLEKLKKKGFEVLYMVEPIDEYMIQQVTEFKEKKLMSVSKADIELGEENEDEKKALAETSEQLKPLCDKLKEILADKVEDVIVSNRIVDSPCCLVTGQYGWSANMERIMKAQALGNDQMKEFMMRSKKKMEINPGNTVIQNLSKNLGNPNLEKYARLLFDTALLDSGFSLENPRQYSHSIHQIMDMSLKVELEHLDETIASQKNQPLSTISEEETKEENVKENTEAKKEKVSETEVNHTESIKTVDDELTPSQTKELESIVNEMVEKTVEEQESNVGQKLSLEEPGEFDKLDTSKMMELTGHDDNDEPPSLSENK